MTQAAEQLKAQLAELETKDRAELAHFLLTTLDDEEEDPDAERLWEEELVRRGAEIESGAVEGIPAEEVFAQLRERLAAKQG
jgi:putative addiction module component (TIGR02574 family)